MLNYLNEILSNKQNYHTAVILKYLKEKKWKFI